MTEAEIVAELREAEADLARQPFPVQLQQAQAIHEAIELIERLKLQVKNLHKELDRYPQTDF